MTAGPVQIQMKLGVILTVAMMCSPCFADTNAIATLDATIFTATVANQCNLPVDWKAASGTRSGAIGKAAYAEFLAELNQSHPNDPANPQRADQAVASQMERSAAAAQDAVAEAGCDAAEIKSRLRLDLLR